MPTSGEIDVFSKVIGRDVSFPESMGLTIENVSFGRDIPDLMSRFIASIKKQIGDREISAALERSN